MALPTYTNGAEFKLSIGATYVCGIESGGFTFSVSQAEAMVRDCSTPTAGVFRVMSPGVVIATITGSGKFVSAHYDDIYDTLGAAPTAWTVANEAGDTWTGSFVTTDLEMTYDATGTEFGNISLTLQSSGAIPTFTPA